MRQSSIPANVAAADQNDLPTVGALSEPQHGSNSTFDETVTLLDNIAKILALANLNTFVFIVIVLVIPPKNN